MSTTSILVYGNHDLLQLKECINSIRATSEDQNYEIILIISSNDSSDHMDWYLEQTELIISVSSDHLNVPKSWNEALSIAKGENILFINSEALVTTQWLSKLLEDFSYTSNIGIIAPVTNVFTENQTVEAHYESYEELNLLSNSRHDQDTEQVLVVSELCFLFKSSLMQEIGIFDEQLFEGSFMSDFCLRSYQAGYKTLISHKTFVHFNNVHFEKAQVNQEFRWKWSFTEEALVTDYYLIEQLELDSNDSDVLFLGVQCGSSILKMKKKYPNLNVYGIELNDFKNNIASLLPNIKKGDIFEQIQIVKSREFKRIIISPYFFDSSSGIDSLNLILKNIPKDAEIFFESNNKRHYKQVNSLITNEKKTNSRYEESLELIISCLEKNHFYEMTRKVLADSLTTNDKELYEYVKGNLSEDNKEELLISKTFIQFRRSAKLEELIEKISSGDEVELTGDLVEYDSEILLKFMKKRKMNDVGFFNYLASFYIENNQYKSALDILEYSYSLDSQNDHTLLNLGMVYYLAGNDHEALKWFKHINEKSEQILKWIAQLNAQIVNEQNIQKSLLKYLLRIEYNVLSELSLKTLSEEMEIGKITEAQVAFLIDKYIIAKSQVFNEIAVHLYNDNKLEIARVLLKKAIDQKQATDTTFLYLAFILIKSGDFTEAYNYLDAAPQQSERIQEWKQKIGYSKSNYNEKV